MDFWTSASLVVGYLVTLLLIRWVVLAKQRQPASTISWILTIVLLPYVGGLLYLFFGVNRVERRAAHKRQAAREVQEHLPGLEAYGLSSERLLTDRQQQLIRLVTSACGTEPTDGNELELLADTNVTLRRIEQAIESARSSLELEYYIWRPDRTGRRIRDLLIRKAREGVHVRFLYDGIGSLFLGRTFLRPMREAGIRVASFLPGPTLRERWSINLRSHRKIVLVDGKVGFTGGMNIGDEYLGRNRQLGYWRDTHLQLVGPTVLQLRAVFAEDWYYATGEEVPLAGPFPAPRSGSGMVAQVVSGGPTGEMHTFHALMFTAINEARHRVTLATSYFVPTAALIMSLETAARRGVDVRLLVAGRSAHPWTVLAGRSYYDSLLRAGVQIHEYKRGILHSKTLTIDGLWSLVGTPNFDARSLLLNFEVGVAIYDSAIAAQLEQHYELDLKHSRKVRLEHWEQRPARHVFAENICRLFAPVL